MSLANIVEIMPVPGSWEIGISGARLYTWILIPSTPQRIVGVVGSMFDGLTLKLNTIFETSNYTISANFRDHDI